MDQATDALGRKSIFKRNKDTRLSNQELGSNLSPEEEAMNKKIRDKKYSFGDKSDLTKEAYQTKIEEAMMKTNDMDELDRLGKLMEEIE